MGLKHLEIRAGPRRGPALRLMAHGGFRYHQRNTLTGPWSLVPGPSLLVCLPRQSCLTSGCCLARWRLPPWRAGPCVGGDLRLADRGPGADDAGADLCHGAHPGGRRAVGVLETAHPLDAEHCRQHQPGVHVLRLAADAGGRRADVDQRLSGLGGAALVARAGRGPHATGLGGDRAGPGRSGSGGAAASGLGTFDLGIAGDRGAGQFVHQCDRNAGAAPPAQRRPARSWPTFRASR